MRAADSTQTGALALTKLEADLEEQINKAKAGDDPDRLKNLARLLVLAKTAEGIAVKEGASDLSSATQEAIAKGLAEFVGKDDYDFDDVTAEVTKRTEAVRTTWSKAVEKLDDIYFEDIAREMDLAGQAAVARFTGKEKYEFGDITKEVASRAAGAVAEFTGKKDYQFGDISKEAMKRGKDFVKDFTGKEEYQFGDLTKAAFAKLFGGGDEKKK